MECTGRFKKIERDIKTGKFEITFTINENPAYLPIEQIQSAEKLNIKAAKYRKKRSLDANAYAWVLIQRIAEAIGSDKDSVYVELLVRYSRKFTYEVVEEKELSSVLQGHRAYLDLETFELDGKTYHVLQKYLGSSTFDSKEMSVFIDGIVSECHDLGIQTETPDEIERMKRLWENQNL